VHATSIRAHTWQTKLVELVAQERFRTLRGGGKETRLQALPLSAIREPA